MLLKDYKKIFTFRGMCDAILKTRAKDPPEILLIYLLDLGRITCQIQYQAIREYSVHKI